MRSTGSQKQLLSNTKLSRQVSSIAGIAISENGHYAESAGVTWRNISRKILHGFCHLPGPASLSLLGGQMATLDKIRELCGELLAAQDDQEAIFTLLPELREALQEAMDQREKPGRNGHGNGPMAA